MSQRDYKLTIKLEIDRQSLNELTSKLNEAFGKSFSRILRNVGRFAAGGDRGEDGRVVNLMTKLVNEVSAMNGRLSRMMRARRRDTERPRERGRRRDGLSFSLERLTASGAGFLAKGVALGMAIFESLKFIVSKATEFSGQFKASMKLLDTVIGLFLKPILDIVGLLLRPFLILLLPVAVLLNRTLGPIITKIAAGVMKGDPATILGLLFGAVTGGVAGVAGGKVVGGAVSGAVGGLAGRIVGGTAGGMIGRIAGGAIGAIGGPAGVIVGSLIGGYIGSLIGDLLSDHKVGEGIIKSFSDFASWLSSSLGWVGENIMKGWDWFVNSVSSFLGDVWKRISDAWGNFIKWISEGLSGIWAGLSSAWGLLVGWFSENFGGIGAKLGEHLGKFISWISENLGGIGSFLGDVWNSFIGWIRDNVGKIGSLIGGAWESFTSWVVSNLGNIGKMLGNAWSGFVDWVLSNFGKIGELIGKGWDAFVKFITGIGKAISDTLVSAWEKIVGFFTKLGEIIGRLLRGDFLGALDELSKWIFGGGEAGRGQFGLTVPMAGKYYLEAGEVVLGRGDVMRLFSMLSNQSGKVINITVPVTIEGDVYGIRDFEEVVKRVVSDSVGNILYDVSRRGVR